MEHLKLSVLDQAPLAEGATASEALRNSIDLAQLADRLGFQRYWVAEHHGSPALACNSPEVLIGPIASATQKIRVGSGGIMLPHYSPLKVAENFGMLSSLYPDRIDLGLGRAAGTSQGIAFALQRDRRQQSPDDFPEQLKELLSYFGQLPATEGPFPQLAARAREWNSPEPWLLGSSAQSSVWAAEYGLSYCFAEFINPNGAGAAAHYRANFRASAKQPVAYTAVAAWVICAETDGEAERLASSSKMIMRMMARGRLIPVPSVEKAEAFLKSEDDAGALPINRRLIAGSPSTVRDRVVALRQEYSADEVFLVNILYSHEARRRSYELVAEAFGLTASGSARAA